MDRYGVGDFVAFVQALRANAEVIISDDVLAAQAVGMTGVLVRTGKFHAESVAELIEQPDVVLDSFAAVPGWLGP